MKRILSVLLACLAVSGSVAAADPVRGYRGFVEWCNDLGAGSDAGYDGVFYYSGVSTTHGYQLSPQFYLGAGLEVEYFRRHDRVVVPLFVEARTDHRFGRFTPYASLRAGYDLSDEGDLYLSPTVGYRFGIKGKWGLNIGVGLTLERMGRDRFSITPQGDVTEIKYVGHEKRLRALCALRLGFDF